MAIVTSHRLELVEWDLVTHLPVTERGNRYVLTMVDHFTKFALAFAVPDMTADTTLRCLREFTALLGYPERLLNDQGRNFISAKINDFCSKAGIKHSQTSVAHPNCNGLAEKLNGILVRGVLRKTVAACQNAWDDHLPQAVFDYNSSIHTVTGSEPYELMFGRSAAQRIDRLLQIQTSAPQNPEASGNDCNDLYE